MSEQSNETIDEAGLTKPKKQRSEAQKAATERMRSALESKQLSNSKITPEEKKLRLQAIKEQLNGPLKKNIDKTPITKVEVKKEEIIESDPETEIESEEEAPPPQPKKKASKIVSQLKKKAKVIYESESESEEEVIVVKKKKKPKKKTIIYEDTTESEEEPVKPVRKERETKTQQNVASKFKVTPGTSDKPKGPVCYFAD